MENVKAIGLSYILSLAAGGLCHKAVYGKLADDDKAAMGIITLTVGIIIGIFCTVGIRRWRTGKLSNYEKRIMILSLCIMPTMFMVGWCVAPFG
jgi:hypothetical protein